MLLSVLRHILARLDHDKGAGRQNLFAFQFLRNREAGVSLQSHLEHLPNDGSAFIGNQVVFVGRVFLVAVGSVGTSILAV